MKRKLLRASIVALILLLVLAIPVLASYSATITVTENAGNSYSMLPIIDTMDVSSMVTSGFISSTGRDTRVLSGSTELPHLLADDKLLFASPITANSTKQFTLTTGNTDVASYPIIVGSGGYITVPDNAAWEPHDSFALEFELYLLTSGSYVIKEDALEFYYNASTEVLYAIIGDSETPDIVLEAENVDPGLHIIKLNTGFGVGESSEIVTLRPTADGDEHAPQANPGTGQSIGTAQYRTYANADYQYVDEVVSDGDSYPGDNSGAHTWLYNYYANSFTALFSGDDIAPGSISTISGVKVWVNARASAIYGGMDCRPTIKIGSTKYYTSITPSNGHMTESYRLYSSTWATNPATGEAWTISDINNMTWGAYIVMIQSLGYANITQVYLEIIDSGYPEYELYIDGSLEDSEQMTSPIPDNNSDWILYPNPYFNYFSIATGN